METPHSIWLVSDEHLKGEILELCREIEHYRELEVVNDIMLGVRPDSNIFHGFIWIPAHFAIVLKYSIGIIIQDPTA